MIPRVKNYSCTFSKGGAVIGRIIVQAPTMTLARLNLIHDHGAAYVRLMFACDKLSIHATHKAPRV